MPRSRKTAGPKRPGKKIVLADVYRFYNDIVKLAFCTIEAEGNNLPIELLFEIHAAFEHLKRFHLGEEVEDDACRSAKGHLKRAALDAFKLKLKYFHRDCKVLLSRWIDLSLIDNGTFYADLLKLKKAIEDVAKRARMAEGRSHEDAFDLWFQVSNQIDDFRERFFDSKKLNWARSRTVKVFGLTFATGVVTGVLGNWAWAKISGQGSPPPNLSPLEPK